MANVGGFFSALGQAFGGYGQDEQNRQAAAREAERLAMQQENARQGRETHAAQMRDANAQAAQRTQAAQRATAEQGVWNQYGEAALNGDQAAMAQVIGTYGPDRAGQILSALKKSPRTQYDAQRGVIVNLDDGSFSPLPGLPAGRDVAPVMGSPAWIKARAAELELERKYRGNPNGESPDLVRTRRDLKEIQGQQVRAEHDVSAAKGDIRQLLSPSQHPRAALPLNVQRNAADSAAANLYGNSQQALTAAELRKKRLTFSADSTQGVINRLRQGAPGTPPVGAPPPGRLSPDRAQAERDNFNDAIKQASAIKDPAQRLAAKRQMTAAYTDRMTKINAGIDPDDQPDVDPGALQ